jgi:hypothetical protein
MSQRLVINFNVPPELFGHPPVTPANPTTSNTSGIPPINSQLFSAVLKPAVLLSLDDFCATYHPSPDILMHFTENGFRTLNQLCYIFVADLEKMVFKHGEIAGIQDAVAMWTASQNSN